ncbi:MAG: CAP domain-containing protein [archaeon]|nr:CAP domain-containing protein [archaeon]
MKQINYDQLTQDLIEEHNIIRTDPQSYIPKLQECLKNFREKIYHQPGEDPLQTYEGKEAIEEAIEFLNSQEPMEELEFRKEIADACKDHINDIGPKGLTTHEGSDGSNISERLEKYCEWDGACAESIDFGFRKAENIIINLLVDDGVTERYQRKNLFHPDLKYFGVAVGPHKNYGICAVIGYTKGIRKLGEEPTEVADFIQDYIKHTMNKEKNKNAFQEDDPDAPDDTVSVKILKVNKNFDNRVRKITKKIYTLKSGAQHIVEIEDS